MEALKHSKRVHFQVTKDGRLPLAEDNPLITSNQHIVFQRMIIIGVKTGEITVAIAYGNEKSHWTSKICPPISLGGWVYSWKRDLIHLLPRLFKL